MSWIKTVPYESADSKLKSIYDKVKGPNNNIDNVLLIHSLRPHTLIGHMTLYKSVLHSSGNTLPKWYLEALGVYVSHLNKCGYCIDHHFQGFRRLMKDEENSTKFQIQISKNMIPDIFELKYTKGFEYAQKLTLAHHQISEQDIGSLRTTGFSDGEILEINQVCSYFNYVNRMVVGLGVNTKGDIIGLSPNDNADPENWSHV